MESRINEPKLPAEIAIPLLTKVKIEDLGSSPQLLEHIDQQVLRYTIIEQTREIGRLTLDLAGAHEEIERLQDRTLFLNNRLKEKDRTIKGYRKLVEVLRKDFNFNALKEVYLWTLFLPGIRQISDRWLKRKLGNLEQDQNFRLS